MRLSFFCLLGLILVPPISPAQMRYHFGNDPRWSDPNFDDSAWPVAKDGMVRLPPFHSDGFLWVRQRLPVPPADAQPLAIRLPGRELSVGEPSDLWVNGRKAGTLGSYPPHLFIPLMPETAVFDIPAAALGPGETALIARRLWTMPWERALGGRGRIHFEIGPRPLLRSEERLSIADSRMSRDVEALEQLLMFGVSLVILIVWWKGGGSRAMLWFGVAFLCFSILTAWASSIPAFFRPRIQYVVWEFVQGVLYCGGFAALLEFQWAVFNLKNLRVLRCLQAMVVVGGGLAHLAHMPVGASEWVSFGSRATAWIQAPAEALAALVCAWQFGVSPENRWIAAAIFGFCGSDALVLWGVLPNVLHFGPFVLFSNWIAGTLLAFAVCAMLLRRFWKTWRERQELDSEFQAASEMQQLLVPAASGSAGFHVASAYLPAKHVGGDFFWTIPSADGSLLLVTGDVSGKGLRAAMTVATLAGALRNEPSREPARVLERLNRVLLDEKTRGFTTCCAALFHPDGLLNIANAGHIAPWLNGCELPVGPGLPLGITPEAEYAARTFSLQPSDRLTFVSDGVVEARNPAGELYGFERTRELAAQTTAPQIAETAREFGQEDDITVITIERIAEVAHAA